MNKMNILKNLTIVSFAAATLLSITFSDSAMASEPRYKAVVPESITTPDRVQTRYIGELEFVDGFPTDETVTKSYDFLDTSRAVELFLDAIPVTSMYAMLNGHLTDMLSQGSVCLELGLGKKLVGR